MNRLDCLNKSEHGRRKRGDGGTRPPQSKNQWGTSPPEIMIFQHLFLDTCKQFAFSTIFKIKWPKSEERLNFGGRWVWVPMNPSPQTKIRGDAPESESGESGQPEKSESSTTLLSIHWSAR